MQINRFCMDVVKDLDSDRVIFYLGNNFFFENPVKVCMLHNHAITAEPIWLKLEMGYKNNWSLFFLFPLNVKLLLTKLSIAIPSLFHIPLNP